MTAWPASLPQAPMNGAFAETFDDNVIRFQPEVGPAKTRRRTTLSTSKLAPEFVLTPAQAQTFTSFFRDTLKDGALTFTFIDPISGVVETYIFTAPPSLTHSTKGALRLGCQWQKM